MQTFEDSIPVGYAIENNIPLSWGIRVLMLDQNYIGPWGAAIIGESLPKMRALKVLSLETNRISDSGSEGLFEGLKKSRLVYLSLASNPLSNSGIVNLSLALWQNKYLKFLDIFDVEFSDEGAIPLTQWMIENKTLECLYLSNTRVSYNIGCKLAQSLLINKTIRVFKWSNLHAVPEYDFEFDDKIIDIEHKTSKISKATFKSENRIDLILTIVEDYYKWTQVGKGEETAILIHKYVDFVLDNWEYLQKGQYFRYDEEDNYKVVAKFPTEKLILDQATVENNDPCLEEDGLEFRLLNIKRIETNLDIVSGYFPDKGYDSVDRIKARIAAKKKQHYLLSPDDEEDKVDEDMLVNFIQDSAYTNNMGKHIMYTLCVLGFDINVIDPATGLNVIHKCVASRNQVALELYLNYFTSVDMNIKGESGDFEGMTPLHISVLSKEINLVEALCQYKGSVHTNMETLNYDGQTVLDLAMSYYEDDDQDQSKLTF